MDATDAIGHLGQDLQVPARQPRHGRRHRLAMSGIDQALWDIRGKAVGWPLYKLLGGSNKPVPAYAGGVSLGYQEPDALVGRSRAHGRGRLQGGEAARRRHAEAPISRAWRRCARRFGDDIAILTDANTGYTVADARQRHAGDGRARHRLAGGAVPGARPPLATRMAKGFGSAPLAAGENHYTRFEFHRVIEDGAITILQPDLSKTGGITEALRIAAAGLGMEAADQSAHLDDRPQQAASIHFLAAIDNGGYFEGDVSSPTSSATSWSASRGRSARTAACGRWKARHRRRGRRGVPGGPSRHRGAGLCVIALPHRRATLGRLGGCDPGHIIFSCSLLMIARDEAKEAPHECEFSAGQSSPSSPGRSASHRRVS